MTASAAGRALLAAGSGILVLLTLALALHVPGSIWAGTLLRKDSVIGLLGAASLLYFVSVALVLRVALPASTIWGVAVLALLMRAVLLAAPPFMSSDVYRYVWDGRVQAAGINPYRYVPADPALARLRDAAIYPDINRADYARTIYPPAAQMIFAAAGRISQTVQATKLALVLLEAAGMAAMLRLLAATGLPPARLLIYAWNPLATWSVAADGHIDGAAIGFLGLALLARLSRVSAGGRSIGGAITGILLACAILTKFLPAAVAPAFWRKREWSMPAACLCVIAVLYAYYADVGWRVFGFLGTYAAEEGMTQGSGFWLLQLLGSGMRLPASAGAFYLVSCAAALGALAVWIIRQKARSRPDEEARRACGNMGLLAAGTVCAMSPHYPWYYAWLALPCVIRPWRSVVFLSAAPLILYCDPFHDLVAIPSLVFVPAAILAVADIRRARLPAAPSLHEGAHP